MPNPHFDVKLISRGKGQSAIASAAYRSGEKLSVVGAAAYRSGEKLQSNQARHTFDYTRKEDVVYREIIAPNSSDLPPWVANREQLWNEVERVEKRKDAQLARDIIAALPRELNTEQQIALVRDFVQENFTAHGMVADVALHEKQASDGGSNPHVHIMLTTRDISASGFGKKNRDWNNRTLVTEWRDSWADITNRYLDEAGSDARLDLRSYDERGIDRQPGEHMGYEAWNLEEKGRETAQGDLNREITHDNALQDIISDYVPVEADNDNELDDVYELEERADEWADTGDTNMDIPDAQAHHESLLRATLQNSVQMTMRATAELVNRMQEYARTVVEAGRNLFDRFTGWTAREQERAQERDREIER